MTALLTDAQIEQFHEEGYTVAEDVFDPEVDFRVLKQEYSDILDGTAAEMLEQGAIQSYDPQATFSDRVVSVWEQAGDVLLQRFDISLPQENVTEDTPMYLGKGAFDLLTHRPLIDIVEQLLGPELYSNPVQHIRMRVPASKQPPSDEQTETGITLGTIVTPWHQDSGVITEDAERTDMLSVWVPVADVTAESGCLTVVPGSHKRGIVEHCPLPTVQIPDQFVREDAAIPVPMRAGSALFFTRYTMHCARANRTDAIRWSFDLRYHPTGQYTGRSWFPGFVVRSKSDPLSVLADHGEWVSLWDRARARIAEADSAERARQADHLNRWSPDAPWCA